MHSISAAGPVKQGAGVRKASVRKTAMLIAGWLVLSLAGFSAEQRDILQKEAEKVSLAQVLTDDFSALGFPAYRNRDFWDHLPPQIRQQYIREAAEYLDYDWPVVKATDYLEIIRSGDRRQEVYAAPRAALTALVMGELAEGEGRFLDQIVNGVWYYSEQTWWGWSAHLTMQKAPHGLPDAEEPVIDLGVGEMTSILSWTWFLFRDAFDKIHPLIARRLKDEIMEKAVNPFFERDDFWWMGLEDARGINNWNPWTNHNMLTAVLLLVDDPERRTEGVQKVVRSLDVFLNVYPEDGGCDEGPSYWGRAGASLFQCLDLLKRATSGKFDVFDHPLIKNMGSYIYKAYIDYPYFINFADADATTGSRPQIIYSYGKAIGDPTLKKFGAFLAQKQGWGEEPPGGKVDEQIMQLMHLKEIENVRAENALIPDFWLPDIEVAGARDQEGDSKGFFFAAKGGHNAESHNHNDLGTCVMYFNGRPCLIDIGRETYTAKTFSSRRYEIWTMQSQYHNLPRINGEDQRPGGRFRAINTSFEARSKSAVFSTDIAGAYPEEAAVRKWVRTYRLDRGKRFTIRDEYELESVKDAPTTLNFVTCCKVVDRKNGILQLEGDGYTLEMKYNSRAVTPRIEYKEVTDRQLHRYWPGGIYRIVFAFSSPEEKGKSEIVITEKRAQ